MENDCNKIINQEKRDCSDVFPKQRRIPLPPQRKFLGKTENFESKKERTFYQRMLKAYLQGKKTFCCGFDKFKNPRVHDVMQSYF